MTTIALLLASSAFASAPEDVVQYRHVQMEIAAKHMKSTTAIVKGKIERKQDLAAHAAGLQAVAATFGELFPEGTGPDKVKDTEARAEVWSKRSEFDTAVKAFQDATKAFADAAAKGEDEAIMAAFGKVGKSCKGCHDNFKVEDEH